MEIGLGFVIGAFAGLVLVVIGYLVVTASRKAAGMTRRIPGPKENGDAKPDKDSTETKVMQLARNTDVRLKTGEKQAGNTVIIEANEDHEGQLNKSIQEVRNLLLKLADVISSTDKASGRAAEAFNAARDTIGAIAVDEPDDLLNAQRLLLKEIDRVLRTNVELQNQLDNANQGIEQQRRQIEELRTAARVDCLTRIPNRAAFDERLQEYLALLNRTQMIFSLLILDVDFFKKVNDDHGHLNGDRILRGVATKISHTIRTHDFSARYGGEEFAVIFPNTKADAAHEVAERMRQDIAHTNFRLDDKNVRITISGGLAEAEPGLDADALIAKADQALYRAKNGGRSRIAQAD